MLTLPSFRQHANSWWRAWAAFVKACTPYQHDIEFPALRRLGEFKKGVKVLDAGAGVGRVAKALAPYCGHLFACESDSYALKKLFQLAKRLRNLHVVKADIHQMPFEDSAFDITYSAWVVQSGRVDLPRVLTELWRVTKPGGRILIVTENSEGDDAEFRERLQPGNKRRREERLAYIKNFFKERGAEVREERAIVNFVHKQKISQVLEIWRQVVWSGREISKDKQKELTAFIKERRRQGKIHLTQGASFIKVEKPKLVA